MKEKSMEKSTASIREPSLLDVFLPVGLLIVMLGLAVFLFGEDASYGPNQIALVLSALLAAGIGIKNGATWENIRKAIISSISQAMGAILILLSVGTLIGTWMMSGTVASMIYYGLQILQPEAFYPTALIVAAIVSASIGSSWTTVGTVGLGLIGIAQSMGMSVEIAAGAVVSGAYFGDKLSPLSDTTNLAPAVAGTDLYTHIRHMLWTTIPSISLALIIFTIIGFSYEAVGEQNIDATLTQLKQYFEIDWYLLLPVVALLVLAIKKFPPIPTIITGALLGGIFAAVFQKDVVLAFIDRPDLGDTLGLIAGVWKSMYGGYQVLSSDSALSELFNRGGMSSMLDVIWLILTALMFGGVLEHTGLLNRLLQLLLKLVHGTGSLIATTVATCFSMNVLTSDQYMSIVLPGRMFKVEYERRQLAPENLSRTLEDSGTLTSPLIPWNTCGAYMAGTMDVATLAYGPYAFFNWINPFMAIAVAYSGISIRKLAETDRTEEDFTVEGESD
jgi:NhaC family Na+:H+ antiporter